MKSKYDFYFDNKNFLEESEACGNECSASLRLFVVIPIEDALQRCFCGFC